eukprot:7147198-Alexandrium_andersonii.AAC.1
MRRCYAAWAPTSKSLLACLTSGRSWHARAWARRTLASAFLVALTGATTLRGPTHGALPRTRRAGPRETSGPTHWAQWPPNALTLLASSLGAGGRFLRRGRGTDRSWSPGLRTPGSPDRNTSRNPRPGGGAAG